jgi:hypothetical protein
MPLAHIIKDQFFFPLMEVSIRVFNLILKPTIASFFLFLVMQEIDEEDERVLEAFLRKDAGPQCTLADIIVEKIKQKDAKAASG